jgi:GAF domain-containing protein
LLVWSQVGQAKAQQRVRQQPVALDRLVASRTDAVSALIHAVQGRINLLQQPREVRHLRMRGAGRHQPAAPLS